jgi:hypothetical protein
VTSSVDTGTVAPTHVVVALQLPPVIVEVIFVAKPVRGANIQIASITKVMLSETRRFLIILLILVF